MLRIAATLILVIFSFTIAFSQAKKPTIMVIPSDVWCNANGYMMEFDNQGKKVKIPDYKKALQENADLLLVISKINELMADRGFPLKDLGGTLKTIESDAAEEAMLISKSGAELNETPVDKLKKVAKSDIIMQLTWSTNTVGPKKSITFNLQGLDAYTDKQVAGTSGTGQPSFTAEVPVLLQEAVLANLDNFNAQLQKHFDDLFANGREVTLRIKTWDSFDGNLEKEYNGKELSEIIEGWMTENTNKGRFSTTDATENMMYFEQVRIPLFDDKNKAYDTKGWSRNLQKYLKDAHGIDSKLMTKGLGQASLIIGDK